MKRKRGKGAGGKGQGEAGDKPQPTVVDPARLQAALERWRGTPFFPQAARPGAGVDCVRFVAAVLAECGVDVPRALPRYAVKGGGPELLALLESHLAAIADRQAPSADLRAGDVLLFSNVESGHHLGICADAETFWHVRYRGRVGPASLADARARGLLCAVYRPAIRPIQNPKSKIENR